METVELILGKLGGYAAVAEKTKIPATTVHSWQRANFVPEWRRPVLISLARKSKIPLENTDFPSRAQAVA